MEKILNALEQHFAETTIEQREKVWSEIEKLNLSGPEVFEYLDYLDRQFPIPNCGIEIENISLEENMTQDYLGSYFFCNIAS